MLSWKEQTNPNNNSKNKPECIKQLFKPLNNMGFLVHQQGAKLSPIALCDGWWCICVSSAGRSSTFTKGHVAVCTRLRKAGRKEASFSVPVKKDFSYCPLIEQMQIHKWQSIALSPRLRKNINKRGGRRCRGLCATSKLTKQQKPSCSLMPTFLFSLPFFFFFLFCV